MQFLVQALQGCVGLSVAGGAVSSIALDTTMQERTLLAQLCASGLGALRRELRHGLQKEATAPRILT